MDIEELTRMDAEADELIKSWSLGPFSENADIETCTKKMRTPLNGVYAAALSPDLITEYGMVAGQWVIDQAPGLVFGYAVSKVGNALKKVCHDILSGNLNSARVGDSFPRIKSFAIDNSKIYILYVGDYGIS